MVAPSGSATTAVVRSMMICPLAYLLLVLAVDCCDLCQNGRLTTGCIVFSKQVQFIWTLHGLIDHGINARACHTAEDDDSNDSLKDARDKGLASMNKHCKGKRYLFCPVTNQKGR